MKIRQHQYTENYPWELAGRLSLLAFLLLSSCSAQNQRQPVSHLVETGEMKVGDPKLIKNHFYAQYPDEFFFVQCGLQDRAGNMWFGCAGDGIYRYDGKSFLNFTQRDALCHNDVLCCLEDKSGTIWFGTRNGLIRYQPSGMPPSRKDFACIFIPENTVNPVTRAKIPYTYDPADNFVWSILEDRKGVLWFGTSKGMYLCDPETAKGTDAPTFTRFLDDEALVNAKGLLLLDVADMEEDRQGNIWFASGYEKGEGICQYDGKRLIHFNPDGLRSFRSILERQNGDLLFLNAFRGIFAYDGQGFSNLSVGIGIEKDTLVAMLEDRAGVLWLGANSDVMEHGGQGGVIRYDGAAWEKYTVQDGLSHNCVFCIVEDREGNLWFGTRNTGLCRFDGKRFTDFTE